jgi:hypothetical protein
MRELTMKSKGRPAGSGHEGIDWRALLPLVVEAIRPIYRPDGNGFCGSDYRRALVAAIEPLIPAASIRAYGETERDMAAALNNRACVFQDGAHDEDNGIERHAFEAIQDIAEDRALITPAASREDALDRLEYVVRLEGGEEFPDGVISMHDALASILADLRRFDGEPVRKAA